MEMLKKDTAALDNFVKEAQQVADNLRENAGKEDIDKIEKLISDFKMKTSDFYRENRKLNIGVVGQVKAGKSSFLNTLLFGGKEVLPKASTPKTATLTKMEYSEENIIRIEYYTEEEWEILEDNAKIDSDEDVFTSAREIIGMVKKNGINPHDYLYKGSEEMRFDTYDDLIEHLNDYVGENGIYTPIVKAVTLFLGNEEFKGLSIVDTPGLNDPIPSRTIRTREFMELCDVVFFLSQTDHFLDKSDWTLLSSQLPQKGVKRLVLIGSKYDSGVRDVLKKPDEFDDPDEVADTIPKACNEVNRKLKKRARDMIETFLTDLDYLDSSEELKNVIRQCSEPILISAMVYNMSEKDEQEFSEEEKNVYNALSKFSDNIREDMRLLGNVDTVREIFASVADEKEKILTEKARSFVPNAKEELKNMLLGFKEKSEKRVAILEGNDKLKLAERKTAFEKQIGSIRGDMSSLFGELATRLETSKTDTVKELRNAEKIYLELKQRNGTKESYEQIKVSDFRLFHPSTWFKHHYETITHTEHYTYCVASDALESIKKYALEATGLVENTFSDTVNLKELRRRMLDVVINNFDTGSENYDASYFRIIVEDTLAAISFPIFKIDISDKLDRIATEFKGEIISASEQTRLSSVMSGAISKIFEEICDVLTTNIKSFKEDMLKTGTKAGDALLANILKEFDELLAKFNDKEKEIDGYNVYITLLDAEIKKM